MLSIDRLKHLVSYEKETGQFEWLNPTRKGLKTIGTNHQGYLRIRIDGKKYMAHRLAWFYTYGSWPVDQIDHINGVKSDNRIANLREATNPENCRNKALTCRNKSGYKGVHFDADSNKWRASCRVNGKLVNIGRFAKVEDASNAYQNFAKEAFGNFHRKE